MVASRTQEALALVAQGMTPRAAARQVGIDPGGLSRALKRQRAQLVCPSCGQVVREGFTLKPTTLPRPPDDA